MSQMNARLAATAGTRMISPAKPDSAIAGKCVLSTKPSPRTTPAATTLARMKIVTTAMNSNTLSTAPV